VSAVGTYLNRDLYGGLLAMLTPFPALLLVLVLVRRRANPTEWPTFLAQTLACGLLLLTIVTGLTRSLSRMAVAAAIAGLAFAALVFATSASRWRYRWLVIALVAGFPVGVWALAPRRLVSRYEELIASGEFDANRLPIWKETVRMIADYPLTGCGLGCRKSGYLAYKTSMPQFATDYAHSDYLQAIAELGLPGFLVALAAAGSLLREVLRAARHRHDPAARLLALACAAAMTGLAIHSLVDFNLHQPSTMLVLAWIAGLGSATAVAPGRREREIVRSV
jgi:O-antigen ligase